jgi:hypothetical protein
MNDLFSDDLFEKLISDENLYYAYLKSIRNKRFRPDVLNFSYVLEKELMSIKKGFINHNYIHGNYYEFIVNDSKKRTIKAAPFKDRVVHHASCNILEPLFEKGFIFDNYACRNLKGAWKAILRLQSFINKLTVSGGGGGGRLEGKKIYCLKCDISKYFDNIDHGVLKKIIRKKIYSPGLL